jgi:hypothetical protein
LARLDDRRGPAASRLGTPSSGRRRAGRKGSAPAAVAERSGGNRRAADARPGAESRSVGPRCAGGQVRSTKVSIVAQEASLSLRVPSQYLDGQEARNASAAREPFDRRRFSQARPPHYRFRKETKATPVAGWACARPAYPSKRLPRSGDRERHRAPSRAATSSTPLLSELLCRSARISLRPELSLCMGATRTWGLSVNADPLQNAEHRCKGMQRGLLSI